MIDRKVLSPLLATIFVFVALSGLILIFHLGIPRVKAVHEWLGIGLIVLTSAHLLVNRKAFNRYCKTESMLYGVALAVVFLILVIMLAPENRRYGRQHRYSFIKTTSNWNGKSVDYNAPPLFTFASLRGSNCISSG